MKLFVILAAVAWSNAAKLDNTYLPPSHSQTSGGSGFLQAPFAGADQGQAQNNGFARNGNGFGQNGNGFDHSDNGFGQNGNGFGQNGESLNGNQYNGNINNFGAEARPERAQAAFERNAAILRQDNQNDGETYSYAYETENGIYAEENGVATNGVEAQGGYSYTGDDGQVYSVRYTADQNGFVPQGDHLPTPPPVPEEILKALEQNARDEAAGIYDDGSYNEGKYSSGDEYNNNNQYSNNNFNNGNANQYEGDDDSVVTTNALFRGSNNNGFNNGNQAGSNGASQGASQAYLPPFAQRSPNGNGNQGFNNGRGNQGGFNNGNDNQSGFNGNQGANKAYLPPVEGQRSSNGGFGSRSRQPSFSARNGYRY